MNNSTEPLATRPESHVGNPGSIQGMFVSRVVCQFSCGAASAVATKLALAELGPNVVIINAFIQEEHPDNRRFLADCERWFGRDVTVLRDEKYDASTYEVWKRKRFIKGAVGAPCSFHLKRDLLDAFREPGDKIVIGFTVEELDRFENLQDRLKDYEVLAPLIEKNLTKADCLAMIERAGIELPAMYRLGFHNANCIGCPKGGAGYWNKIREVFPEQFIQIADIQESIGDGAKFLRNRRTGERIYLRELDPTHGNIADEPAISCSFFCEMAEQDIGDRPHATEVETNVLVANPKAESNQNGSPEDAGTAEGGRDAE